MNTIKGKVAYITGGSKGIGYGIAKKLLDNGMHVAISSRTMEAAKQAAASLSADASRILALQSNVGSLADEIKAIEATVNYFGQMDVLVANAGVGHFANVVNF